MNDRPSSPSESSPRTAWLRRLGGWTVARLSNLHWVDERLARSAQLYGRHTALILELYGFRTVINLRGENPEAGWYSAEAEACRALGVVFLDVPINSRRIPRRAELQALLQAFDALEAPALIKCAGGADRTGLACFLYLIDREGPERFAAAQRHLTAWPYLHIPKLQQRWLRLFLVYWQSHRGPEMPLRRWLDEIYDPQDFADWLNAQGKRGTYRNV
ncbi:phosphatase domain-containing protein [Algihabitans albus]|uniref:phosphatase domain-containing protein n=1 Tax=Algihabitans albus TaxID=2164067 RepID=UPI000E5C910B|nr:sulfur transferase domain-containing protein [Algihabitans albus]